MKKVNKSLPEIFPSLAFRPQLSQFACVPLEAFADAGVWLTPLVGSTTVRVKSQQAFPHARVTHMSTCPLVVHPSERQLQTTTRSSANKMAPSISKDFDPDRDIPDLSGKVIIVTGGT
jgi:hypothetical protein